MIRYLGDESIEKYHFDVVVLGSGIAGTAFLDGLISSGYKGRVAVLESGISYYSQQHQMQNIDSELSGNYFPLAATRIRQLGGTSNHWTGLTGRSEAAVIPVPGFQRERGYYYDKADKFLQVNTTEKDSDFSLAPEGMSVFKWSLSPPTRLIDSQAKLYHADVCDIFLDATAVDFEVIAGSVISVTARTFKGREAHFFADKFVLAAGGIDSPRLLLHSGFDKLGVKNIGVGFCEHPHIELGQLHCNDDSVARLNDLFLSKSNLIQGLAYKSELGSGGVTLRAQGFEDGALDVATSFRKLSYRSERGTLGMKDVLEVGKILSSPWSTYQFFKRRSNGARSFDVRAMTSQSFSPNNRVILGDKNDVYGVPLPQLIWSAKDNIDLFLEIAMAFGAYVRREKLGALEISAQLLSGSFEKPSDILGGFHHMSTLAIGDNDNSPVDLNLRLRGIQNLYVLGSSVFPKLDFVNPSLTIAALSYYVADQI